jgi:hypothetical protein
VSWDLRIFGNAIETTPDEIVQALETRGLAVEWRPRYPDDEPTFEGYFRPQGEKNSPRLIQIGFEEPARSELERLRDDYGGDADALGRATTEYWLSVEAEYDEDWRREGAAIAADLADRAQGVIFDSAELHFYSVGDWRASHGVDP